MKFEREDIVKALEAAGVKDVPQKIADGMTVQSMVRILETAQAKRSETQPRWLGEMQGKVGDPDTRERFVSPQVTQRIIISGFDDANRRGCL